jgi:hypothetical protein
MHDSACQAAGERGVFQIRVHLELFLPENEHKIW